MCSGLVVYPGQKNPYHISFTLKRRVYEVGISEPKPQILKEFRYHVLHTSEKHNLMFSVTKNITSWLHIKAGQ